MLKFPLFESFSIDAPVPKGTLNEVLGEGYTSCGIKTEISTGRNQFLNEVEVLPCLLPVHTTSFDICQSFYCQCRTDCMKNIWKACINKSLKMVSQVKLI